MTLEWMMKRQPPNDEVMLSSDEFDEIMRKALGVPAAIQNPAVKQNPVNARKRKAPREE